MGGTASSRNRRSNLFNAVYLPFYRPDTLGIYLPFAQEIAETNALVPITPQRNLYELYPQHNSMTYAFVFLADGWHNPYPARFMIAVLNLGGLWQYFYWQNRFIAPPPHGLRYSWCSHPGFR